MVPRIAPVDATPRAGVAELALGRMDGATWKTAEAAFDESAVPVFPGQGLTEEEQVALATRFGAIELLAADPQQKAVAISNQKPDGSVVTADEHRFKSLRGNEGRHTDSSCMPLAAKAPVAAHPRRGRSGHRARADRPRRPGERLRAVDLESPGRPR